MTTREALICSLALFQIISHHKRWVPVPGRPGRRTGRRSPGRRAGGAALPSPGSQAGLTGTDRGRGPGWSWAAGPEACRGVGAGVRGRPEEMEKGGRG